MGPFWQLDWEKTLSLKLSKQGTKFQAIAIIQARRNVKLVQSVNSTDSEKVLYSEYILKAEVEVFFDKLNMECENSKFFFSSFFFFSEQP